MPTLISYTQTPPESGIGEETTPQEDFLLHLCCDYPYLMEKSPDLKDIYIEPGWFHIIELLFESIYSAVSYREHEIQIIGDRIKSGTPFTQRSIEYFESYLEESKEILNVEIGELPVITSIKQKLGRLQIYFQGGAEIEVGGMVHMASVMASHTCEICGSPGKLSFFEGIRRVTCEEHTQFE